MDVNYKRVNDTDGELTLRFSDYKPTNKKSSPKIELDEKIL